MGKMKRAPLIVEKSDDFVMEYNGEEYHPHEGEEVVFRRVISPSALMKMMKAANMQNVDQEAAIDYLYEDACPVLFKAIQSWTWTDMYDGEKLELSIDTLRELSIEEINYLTEKFFESAGGGEEKNDSAPS